MKHECPQCGKPFECGLKICNQFSPLVYCEDCRE